MSDINGSQLNEGLGSVFDLPRKSYEIVMRNWQMFAFVNIITIITSIFLAIGNTSTNYNSYSEGMFSDQDFTNIMGPLAIFGIVFALVSIFFYAMTVGLAVKSIDGEKPDVNELLGIGKKYWLRQLGLVILLSIIIGFGLLLLIIPGIIAFLRLSLAPYLMYDRNLGVIDSIKASAELTKGRMGAVAAAIGVMILINIGLGLFGVLPIIGDLIAAVGAILFSLVIALRYRELTRLKKQHTN